MRKKTNAVSCFGFCCLLRSPADLDKTKNLSFASMYLYISLLSEHGIPCLVFGPMQFDPTGGQLPARPENLVNNTSQNHAMKQKEISVSTHSQPHDVVP